MPATATDLHGHTTGSHKKVTSKAGPKHAWVLQNVHKLFSFGCLRLSAGGRRYFCWSKTCPSGRRHFFGAQTPCPVIAGAYLLRNPPWPRVFFICIKSICGHWRFCCCLKPLPMAAPALFSSHEMPPNVRMRFFVRLRPVSAGLSFSPKHLPRGRFSFCCAGARSRRRCRSRRHCRRRRRERARAALTRLCKRERANANALANAPR